MTTKVAWYLGFCIFYDFLISSLRCFLVLFDEHIVHQKQNCLNPWSLASKKCFVEQFSGEYDRNVFVYGSKVDIILNVVIEETQWMKKNCVLRANNEWKVPEEKKIMFFFFVKW